LRQPYLLILLFIFLSGIFVLNGSFKYSTDISCNIKTKLLHDTLIKSNLPLYADTTLSSGYLGNFFDFQPVLNQILNRKRIDSLLKDKPPINYVLTNDDRKNYILNIDQKAIKKAIDIDFVKKKHHVAYLPLKLTNYSKNTLTYISTSCTWLDLYFTNNNRIKFEHQICFSNFPVVNTIYPQHTTTIYIPVLLNKDGSSINRKFRIGMSLQKFINNAQLVNFDMFKYMLRPETSNLIWSNEIKIP